MKQFILFLTILILVFSCERYDSHTINDNILYFDYIPDTSIGTIKYFTPSPVPPSIMNCPNIPTPQDSVTSIYLDVNQDKINDFFIEAVHNKVDFGCGSHCICFYYRIAINGLNNVSFISTYLKDDLDYVPIKYDSLSTVNKDSTWNERAFLYLYSPGAPFSTDFFDCYIGIKICNHYGWINIAPTGKNGIVIKEYALNLTEDKNIKCGQKE